MLGLKRATKKLWKTLTCRFNYGDLMLHSSQPFGNSTIYVKRYFVEHCSFIKYRKPSHILHFHRLFILRSTNVFSDNHMKLEFSCLQAKGKPKLKPIKLWRASVQICIINKWTWDCVIKRNLRLLYRHDKFFPEHF